METIDILYLIYTLGAFTLLVGLVFLILILKDDQAQIKKYREENKK